MTPGPGLKLDHTDRLIDSAMENSDEVLDELQRNTLHHLIPILAMMATMTCVGIVGNSFTIGFYGFVTKKRTPSVYLITALAWADLVASVFTIIPDIIETVINVNFKSDFACKVIHYCQNFPVKVSIGILGFIAIDHYRHVCCPFQKQVTDTVAKWLVGFCVTFAIIISTREFVTVGIVNFPVNVTFLDPSFDMNGIIHGPYKVTKYTTVIVHYCTTKEDSGVDILVTSINSMEAFALIVTLVIIFSAYGKIAWTIKTGGRAIAKSNKRQKCRKAADNSDTERGTGAHVNKDIHLHKTRKDSTKAQIFTNQIVETSSNNQAKALANVEIPKSTKATPPTTSKTKGTEKSITLMMGVISVIFACCFIPYFFVQIGFRSQESSQSSAVLFELGMISQIVTRLPYVNSIANPFVFCLFNPRFRAYIIKTVLRRNWHSGGSIAAMI